MILVTGGTGLVGSHLLRELVRQNYSVRATFRSQSSFQLVRDIKEEVEWIETDILDIPGLEKTIKGVTKVYHCAGMVAFHKSLRDKMMRVNLRGTANIVNFCVDYGVEKIVHVSSVSALSSNRADSSPVTEESGGEETPQGSIYGLSKYLAEREVWRGIGEGIDAVIVNPSVVLGAGDWTSDSSVLFSYIGSEPVFYPPGTMGFVDVEDVAHCMIQLMESDITAERFILNGENWSYKKLFEEMAEALNTRPPRYKANLLLRETAWRWEALKSFFTGNRPRITKETVRSAARQRTYDSSKIQKTLDYQFTPLHKTIQKIAAVFLSS